MAKEQNRMALGPKWRPSVTSPFLTRTGLGMPTSPRARAVIGRALEFVTQDRTVREDARQIRDLRTTSAQIAYLRRKFGIAPDFDGEPRKDLLRLLAQEDLKYWVGGFTEVFNGQLGATRGDYNNLVDDWIERYILFDVPDSARHLGAMPHTEYILDWHIVEYEPKKDIDFKVSGSGGLNYRIEGLKRDIASKRSAVNTDWWLNFGASVGKFVATEAIAFLLGAQIARKLQQLIEASKWLIRLGRTGKFIAAHGEKIAEVASAVLVAAVKSQGSIGEMSSGGLGALLTGRLGVVIEGLGLAVGLLEVTANETLKKIELEIGRDPRSKSTEPRDIVLVDLAQMEAELYFLEAYRTALLNLLNGVRAELHRQAEGK